VTVDVESLIPSGSPVRFGYDDDSLQELADSIRSVGLLEPLVVRPVGDRYEILAGNRRFKACLLAGLNKVPVLVREVDDNQAVILSVTENVNREDMNPLEEAVAFARWLEATGKTSTELAKQLGRSLAYVEKRLMLLNLDEGTMEAVARGDISLHHALELHRVDDVDSRAYLRNLVVKGG